MFSRIKLFYKEFKERNDYNELSYIQTRMRVLSVKANKEIEEKIKQGTVSKTSRPYC